jgi:hypothetical protein
MIAYSFCVSATLPCMAFWRLVIVAMFRLLPR